LVLILLIKHRWFGIKLLKRNCCIEFKYLAPYAALRYLKIAPSNSWKRLFAGIKSVSGTEIPNSKVESRGFQTKISYFNFLYESE
jgi:hypothetical protein